MNDTTDTHELNENKSLILAGNEINEESLKTYLDNYLNTWKNENFGSGIYNNTGNLTVSGGTKLTTDESNVLCLETEERNSAESSYPASVIKIQHDEINVRGNIIKLADYTNVRLDGHKYDMDSLDRAVIFGGTGSSGSVEIEITNMTSSEMSYIAISNVTKMGTIERSSSGEGNVKISGFAAYQPIMIMLS